MLQLIVIMENFNPENYQKIEDIPDEKKSDFKLVNNPETEPGFVLRSAIDDVGAARNDSLMEKDSRSKFPFFHK